METWTQIAAGLLALAALLYAGWFQALWRGGVLNAMLMLTILAMIAFVAAAVWPVFYRLLAHLFFGDPYWLRPRSFEAGQDRGKMLALDARLDLVEVDDKAMLWHDRESGQFWASRKLETRDGVFTRYKPLRRRELWTGMADEDWEETA